MRLEREKNNKAVAQQGWAATLRLKIMREPVAAVILMLAGAHWGPEVFQMMH